MNLNQLYYFKVLAELEHYTKAAEQLSISQPTLSHSIAALEQELGAFLFEKQGRNVVLTKYGKIYLFYVENALNQLGLGRNQIERLLSEGGAHVGLAYMASVGTSFLPNMIAAFLKDPAHRSVTFSCYEGSTKNLVYHLKREKYDLVFCSLLENERDITFVPVYEQPLVAVVPLDHPLAEKESVTVADIHPYPLVSYTSENGMRRIIDDLFLKEEKIPHTLCQFDDVNSIVGLVAENQGVAIVTDNPTIALYDVKRLTFDAPYAKRQVYLAYVKNRYLPPSVQKFRDFVIAITTRKEELP